MTANVDICFTCLSDYIDSGTVRSSLLAFHPGDESTPLPEWTTRDNSAWLSRHRFW